MNNGLKEVLGGSAISPTGMVAVGKCLVSVGAPDLML